MGSPDSETCKRHLWIILFKEVFVCLVAVLQLELKLQIFLRYIIKQLVMLKFSNYILKT